MMIKKRNQNIYGVRMTQNRMSRERLMQKGWSLIHTDKFRGKTRYYLKKNKGVLK